MVESNLIGLVFGKMQSLSIGIGLRYFIIKTLKK